MKITKASIKKAHPRAHSIEQVGFKQLFQVYYKRGIVSYTLIISYITIIGISINSERPDYFYMTTETFSTTTSKQTSQFLNNNDGERVSPATLEYLLRVHETN